MKRCTVCDKEFSPRTNNQRYCCSSCRLKDYSQNNKEKLKENNKRWQNKSKDRRKEISRKHRENNKEHYLLAAARNRAHKFDIPFDLEISDIQIPECCPILGIPLTMNSGKPGGKYDSISLDRINPELGYVKGNVQVISFQANMMKSNASKEDLLKFSEWIIKTYGDSLLHP